MADIPITQEELEGYPGQNFVQQETTMPRDPDEDFEDQYDNAPDNDEDCEECRMPADECDCDLAEDEN